jgi:hypothetical protein
MRRTMTATASIVAGVMGGMAAHVSSQNAPDLLIPGTTRRSSQLCRPRSRQCHHSDLGNGGDNIRDRTRRQGSGRCSQPADMRELAACSMAIAVTPPTQCTRFRSTTPASTPTTPAAKDSHPRRADGEPPHADHRKTHAPIVVDLIHRFADRSLLPHEVEVGEQRVRIGIWSKSPHRLEPHSS